MKIGRQVGYLGIWSVGRQERRRERKTAVHKGWTSDLTHGLFPLPANKEQTASRVKKSKHVEDQKEPIHLHKLGSGDI